MKADVVDLNEYYRTVKERGFTDSFRWPPEIKNLRWGEGFKHPLTAVIFVDIRSFTRRLIHDPEGNYVTLQLFYLSVWKILGNYRCYVEKQTGDGVMIIYPIDSPDEMEGPLRMAKEIMGFLTGELNPFLKTKGIKPFRLGIGIDAGEVVVTKVGLPHHESHLMLFGTEANLAAKMSGLGNNEILIGCGYKEHLAGVDEKYGRLEVYRTLPYRVCNHPNKACNTKRYKIFEV